jgi:two-component system nitrogen regulation sensor histidine kinase NtrY
MRKPTRQLAPDAPPAKPPAEPTRRDGGRAVARSRGPARPSFRARLVAVLLLFAVIPSAVVTAAWLTTTSRTLPLVAATMAWDRVGASGERAISALSAASLTPAQREALADHETELRRSVEMAKRVGFVVPRTVRLIAAGAVVLLVGVALGASRMAGHLARQLSRPLDELVGWTGLIRAGQPLPAHALQRGAPEFDVLRTDMRTMADDLEAGRQRALDAERADAFRESARRFAHELKNPLTPIRFAVDRLRRAAPAELHDTVEVLAEEAARLESMARAFAQFGRLPDGPAADVDVGDLVTRATQATVPAHFTLHLDVADALPLVHGFHDALLRAVTNVLINAVEACGPAGRIAVQVQHDPQPGDDALCVRITDSGIGIDPARLAHIFDPYVTTKPGGTGLGLAIVRQTVAAHGGTVAARSTPTAGTEIQVRLPVLASAAHASSGAPRS